MKIGIECERMNFSFLRDSGPAIGQAAGVAVEVVEEDGKKLLVLKEEYPNYADAKRLVARLRKYAFRKAPGFYDVCLKPRSEGGWVKLEDAFCLAEEMLGVI